MNFVIISLFTFFVVSNFNYLLAQKEFNGVVKIKHYMVDNDKKKSRAAKVLAGLNDLPIEEFDTLYTTSYICGDTIIEFGESINRMYFSQLIEIGGTTRLIYDPTYDKYLRLPVSNFKLAGIKKNRWRNVSISHFEYLSICR